MPAPSRVLNKSLVAMIPLLAAALLSLQPGDLAAATLKAQGEIRARVDTQSLPAADGQTRLKLSVQVPASELGWKSEGDSLRARLRLSWELYALGERFLRVDDLELLTRAVNTDAYAQSFFYAREQVLPPGEYRLELVCKDEGRKVGGLGGLFGHHPESSLSALIQVREYGVTGTLSDPMLYAFLGEDRPSRPKPGGVFGPGESVLELRSSFVPPRELPSDVDPYFSLVLEVRDHEGELRMERKAGWRFDRDIVPLTFRLPLDELEPEDYTLGLDLAGEGLEGTRFEIPFRVLGRVLADADERSRRAIEAELFLSGEEFRVWQNFGELERVEMMRRFWKRHDPNPSTEENEVYDEFLLRFKMAQERFTGFRPGALTHRGRVLIRYGTPDEIQVEVMPMNRRALINAVRDLHGADEIEPGASLNSPDTNEGENPDRQDLDLKRDLSKIGTGNSVAFGNESEPFEVWIYELEGQPLLPEHKLQLHDVGLKLIFADRGGYGDYELVYRSEDFDF